MASMWQRLFGGPDNRMKARPQAARTAAPLQPRPMAPSVSEAAGPLTSRSRLEELFHRFVLELPPCSLTAATQGETAALNRLELLSTRFDMRSLPRLPSVLPQLLRELRSDTAAGGQLAKLIGRDPLLIGEVMRVTSSVFYRSAQPITSLQQAVVLLGQDGLRQVVAQHVMKPILQANAGTGGHAGIRLWDHAERCAHACAWLSRSNGCDGFESYLAGIMCHTGTGAVARLLESVMPGSDAPVSAAFLAQCGKLANRLSLQAAQHWELPSRVIDAIAEMERDDTPPGSPLGKALATADLLAMEQLLREQTRLAEPLEADCSPMLPAALVARCRKDLSNNFDSMTA